MKKVIFLILFIALIIGSCTKQKNKFPQGAWQLVQLQNVDEGGKLETTWSIPNSSIKGSQIKIWSERHFLFGSSGTYPLKSGRDTTVVGGGGGTFTLVGTQYEETSLFHSNPVYRDRQLKNMKLELRNDTLIQTYHSLNNDKVEVIEKYTRME